MNALVSALLMGTLLGGVFLLAGMVWLFHRQRIGRRFNSG